MDEINEISIGECTGSGLQKYSRGSPMYDSVLSWFSRNTSGWKTDIASRLCKEMIKYDGGTIMVSDRLVTINYKDANGKYIFLNRLVNSGLQFPKVRAVDLERCAVVSLLGK